jgi:hypothetical protein
LAIYGIDHKKKNRKPVRRKPGPVPKDDGISIRPGDTGTLTREQKRAAASEKARIEREIRQKEKADAELAATIQRHMEKIEEAKRKAGLSDDEDPEISLTSKMLSDMRWVYSQVDGRRKLLEMVKGDDKQFAFMIKELIRFETAEAERKAGKLGGGNGGGFFVVIKGLEDENRLKSAMAGQTSEISNQRIAITIDQPAASGTDVAIPEKPAAKPAYTPPAREEQAAPPSLNVRKGEEDW